MSINTSTLLGKHIAGMDTLVLLQISSLDEGFVAHGTPVGLLTGMKHLVSLQSRSM